MPNANIDYVTSHQGQAHITTQNVIDLLAGLSGDVSGIKKFPQLYNGLSHEITDALTIQVKTGAALAGGSFFILEEAFDWMLDPGAVGYSRIDVLYVVMSEDPDTAVQSCDFVYEVGNLYPNGTTGTVPSAPTGTNITATYPFLRMDMTDGSIVSVTDYSTPYLSNSSLVTTVNDLVEQLEESVGGTVEQVQTNTNEIAQMKVTFQDGVDTIYDAEVAQGVTPSASTPQALATGIGTIARNKYAEAQAVTWKETFPVSVSTTESVGYFYVCDCSNIKSIMLTNITKSVNVGALKISYCKYMADSSHNPYKSIKRTVEISTLTEYLLPTDIEYDMLQLEAHKSSGASAVAIHFDMNITHQAKKLR